MRAAELGPTVVDPTDSPIGMIGLFHDPVGAPRAGCAVIDVRDRVATNLGPREQILGRARFDDPRRLQRSPSAGRESSSASVCAVMFDFRHKVVTKNRSAWAMPGVQTPGMAHASGGAPKRATPGDARPAPRAL